MAWGNVSVDVRFELKYHQNCSTNIVLSKSFITNRSNPRSVYSKCGTPIAAGMGGRAIIILHILGRFFVWVYNPFDFSTNFA